MTAAHSNSGWDGRERRAFNGDELLERIHQMEREFSELTAELKERRSFHERAINEMSTALKNHTNVLFGGPENDDIGIREHVNQLRRNDELREGRFKAVAIAAAVGFVGMLYNLLEWVFKSIFKI